MASTRPARRADVDTIVALWRSADLERRRALGLPARPVTGDDPDATRHRVEGFLADPGACVMLAEEAGEPVAMAVAVPGLARDGAGTEPVPGLAHVTMVAVRPDRWGQRLGGVVLAAALAGARDRGYTRAQLWTHQTNLRARQLYLRLGWAESGRATIDQAGEPIRHYVRRL